MNKIDKISSVNYFCSWIVASQGRSGLPARRRQCRRGKRYRRRADGGRGLKRSKETGACPTGGCSGGVALPCGVRCVGRGRHGLPPRAGAANWLVFWPPPVGRTGIWQCVDPSTAMACLPPARRVGASLLRWCSGAWGFHGAMLCPALAWRGAFSVRSGHEWKW